MGLEQAGRQKEEPGADNSPEASKLRSTEDNSKGAKAGGRSEQGKNALSVPPDLVTVISIILTMRRGPP